MLTVSELMKPRYKVIAMYPLTPYKIDQILECADEGFGDVNYYKQYPAIFQRIQWWEDRKPEDMPEYVIIDFPNSKPKKVEKWEGYNLHGVPLFLTTNLVGTVVTACVDGFLPATAEEYQAFINNKSTS